jgi:glycosyltransferase involved in cell wall biosynthesis
MNILVIPCTDWLRGPQQRLHHLAKEWSKNNRVYVFYLVRDDNVTYEFNVERLKYSRLIKIPAIRSKNFAFFLASNFLIQFIYLLKVIKFASIDVIVAEGLGPSTGAIIAAKLTRRRIIFDYSDYYPSFVGLYVSNNLLSKLLQVVARLVLRINIRFSDATVAVSDGLYKDGKNYTEHIYKITNGVSVEYFPSYEHTQSSPNNDQVIISFIGAIESWVSLEKVINAIAALNSEGKARFLFQIIGDGSKLKALKELVNQKGLSTTIIFTGWVPYATLHEYIKRSDICVLPFDSGSISAFSMPMKIHEYAISKKPVIATPLPEIKKIYKDSVMYATTAEEYIYAIKLLLRDSNTRLRLIQEAYEVAKKFSWENLAKEYERIFLRVLYHNR